MHFSKSRLPIVSTKTQEQVEIEIGQLSFDYLRSLGKFLRPKTSTDQEDNSSDSVSCCSGESDDAITFGNDFDV
jgi:hypothetical protein